MVVVVKKKGDTKDTLMRKFTRTFIDEDVVTELRNKQFYKKPSLLKKEKEKERLKNRHRR
jgi:ribosomal protein S21